MRKRRAVIFDDEPVVLMVLKEFFEMRGYEVLALQEPSFCPIYGQGTVCADVAPCGDLMLTDYTMPGMNGIELLQAQAKSGCRLTSKNKALLTGYIDDTKLGILQELGAAFFEKPVLFDDLERWIEECEQRMDLSSRLGIKRCEIRECCGQEVRYSLASSDSSMLSGTVVNVSRSGLCLRAVSPLKREDRITLHTVLPLRSPVAQVRWVAPAGQDAYLAGLQCAPAH